jgi:hypothetical protein
VFNMSDDRYYYPSAYGNYSQGYPATPQVTFPYASGYRDAYVTQGAYGSLGGPFANAVEVGKIGAVVGLCGAGAISLHRLQAGELDRRGAAMQTLRGGAVAGVATVAASLVASNFRSDLLSLAATLVTGTAVAYALTAEPTPDSAVATADAAAAHGKA